MKRLGEAARHITKEGRKAISDAQKARWAKAKDDVRIKKEQKTTQRIADEIGNGIYQQLQKENELLKAEINFYRNLILDLKKAA